MKYSVLAALAFVALCSAKRYCNSGVTNEYKSCCGDMEEPWQDFSNSRKGCEDPVEGEPDVP
ncbi:hypothetical protein BUE80_DR002912 [Diplocarpon rosae]|nr:hypothetical protein BUE80_DR002912 [Diplocarpon rosae]